MHTTAPSRRALSPRRRRRLDGERTIAFGIVVPLAFLALDPLEGLSASLMDLWGTSWLRTHAGAGYVLGALALLAFAAAHLFPRRAAWFAGPACVGGPVWGLLGMALLPMTLGAAVLLAPIALAAFLAARIAPREWGRLVGGLVATFGAGALLTSASEPRMLLGLGVLGLSTFGTAAVFLRTAWRALRRVPRRQRTRAKAIALALGALTVAIAAHAQRVVDRRAHELVEAAWAGDDSALEAAIDGLKPFGWLADVAIPFARAGWPVDEPPYRRIQAAWLEAGGLDIQILPDYKTLTQADSEP